MNAVSLDGAWVRQSVTLAEESIIASRDQLTELDRQIGDGDHGENMMRGFRAAAAAVSASEATGLSETLEVLATTLMSTVGGAAGPLYGTAFLRAATVAANEAAAINEVLSEAENAGAALRPVPSREAHIVAEMLAAALGGIQARGKAEVGDKTMVDAWAPAAQEARAAVERGADPTEVLRAAAVAACAGAAATEPLVARKGRASYLGERSIGHRDPGAHSSALILVAAARAAGAEVSEPDLAPADARSTTPAATASKAVENPSQEETLA